MNQVIGGNSGGPALQSLNRKNLSHLQHFKRLPINRNVVSELKSSPKILANRMAFVSTTSAVNSVSALVYADLGKVPGCTGTWGRSLRPP